MLPSEDSSDEVHGQPDTRRHRSSNFQEGQVCEEGQRKSITCCFHSRMNNDKGQVVTISFSRSQHARVDRTEGMQINLPIDAAETRHW